MELSEVLDKYGTDKVNEHTYGRIYDELVKDFDRNAELNIFEVGTYKGQSLKAWREYFPNAKVTGIDIEDQVSDKDPSINYIIQDIKDFRPTEEYDLVIEDGGHWLRDVVPVLTYFPYKLKVGGYLVIEDAQAPELWVDVVGDIMAPNMKYNRDFGGKFEVFYYNLRPIKNRYDDFLIIIQRTK